VNLSGSKHTGQTETRMVGLVRLVALLTPVSPPTRPLPPLPLFFLQWMVSSRLNAFCKVFPLKSRQEIEMLRTLWDQVLNGSK